MSRLNVLTMLMLALAHLPYHLFHEGLCTQPYCVCSPDQHPSWTVVNCSVPANKNLDIFEGDLPETTTDLIISGAEAVLFNINSLSRLRDARRIFIKGPKIILMRKFTAVNLNVLSIYLEIQSCDTLRIEEKAFTNLKGPLSVSINNCEYVSLESEAFSWLLSITIININKLQLSPAAFTLDPTAANVGEHGPGLVIEMKNLTISEITSQTFGSSANRVLMEFVQIENIYSNAFGANTYNAVIAYNCSFYNIHGDAFAQKSLINNLVMYGCKISQLSTRALQSAVTNLNISHNLFENIETEAVSITVANAIITDNQFYSIEEHGIELSSWNHLIIKRNSFDELAKNAIVAPGSSIVQLVFSDNEIDTIHDESLSFIGEADGNLGTVVYERNYFGKPCTCDVGDQLAKTLGVPSAKHFEDETFCTINQFFARCFNVPEQNMVVKKFINNVCSSESSIKCEPFKTKTEGELTEIKNPRFPHKSKERSGISDRNKKVIGIVIVTILGCIIIALFFTVIKWMIRKGYCFRIKNYLVSTNSLCASLCDSCFSCGRGNGIDNAGSISQLSVNEYSERHRLNEPRLQEVMQETALPEIYSEEITQTDDKTTQTLPEELTKELLEHLKEKLDDPETYIEAHEMIEHLYELIKVEESCNSNNLTRANPENIYDLPFQNTAPRMGRNKKQMISIGTRVPSLEKLLPLSPYNRETSLAHEYFEPKDFAIHLYAEIANDRDRKILMNAMPDVVAEQAIPRGPYLLAVRQKLNSSSSSSPSSPSNPSECSLFVNSPAMKPSPHANKLPSLSSSPSPAKMINRPLPDKPKVADAGEGPSTKNG